MNRKQKYVCPMIGIIHVLPDNPLLGTSFHNNGGHNKAGDDGQDLGNAKRAIEWYDENEDEEETESEQA